MKLEHEFRVPVPITQAWDVLLDVERIAPCMPGATVQSFDGETVNGRVKVKVGPIQVTYAGTTRFIEKNEAGRRVTLDATGKEARGSGTAKATIVAVLQDDGDSTLVTVTTDLAITGKPAQFGRGVMVEVGNKLLGRFADCLAEQIGIGSSGEAVAGADEGPAAQPIAGAAAEAVGAAAAASAPAAEVGTGVVDAGEAATGNGSANAAGSAGGEGAAAGDGAAAASGGNGAAGAAGAGAGGAGAGGAGGAGAGGAGGGTGGAAEGAGGGAGGSAGGSAGAGRAAGAGAAGAGAASSPADATASSAGSNGGTSPATQVRPIASASTYRAPARPADNEPLDLLDIGGPAIAKRLVPLAIGVVALLILWRLLRRR